PSSSRTRTSTSTRSEPPRARAGDRAGTGPCSHSDGFEAEEAGDARDGIRVVARRRRGVVVRAGVAPARPRVDRTAAEAKRGVRRADSGPGGAGELPCGDHVAVAGGSVELGEADERGGAGGRAEARACTAAWVGVVPEVPLQSGPLAREREIVLAGARDDELARLVVERLELVILR